MITKQLMEKIQDGLKINIEKDSEEFLTSLMLRL